MTARMFMEDDELVKLTGRRIKSKQIQWLRGEGIPFRVSATGHPVVLRSAVEGRSTEGAPATTGWKPRVLENA